jgi:hypothetical protein
MAWPGYDRAGLERSAELAVELLHKAGLPDVRILRAATGSGLRAVVEDH